MVRPRRRAAVWCCCSRFWRRGASWPGCRAGGGSPSQGWSDGQMMLAVLVLNVAGFDRVSDIEHLEADTGLCALVRRFEPKLLGLSRGAVARRFRGGRERCFPSARSLRDWLDRFHVAGVHDVEREKGTAFIPPHTERHELFRAVARRLVAEGVREAVAASVTIDLDATIIASGKRECLYTYRAAGEAGSGRAGLPAAGRVLPRDRDGAVAGEPRRQRAGGAGQPAGARGGAVAASRRRAPGHPPHRWGGLPGGCDPRLQRPRLPPGGRRGASARWG